mmetsp:Transcript_35510/g.65775  ORF Transcript_35510/g.65775 Transcript_35510/m.65775 type:complete len:80 (+) Transcript_35510:881-1120(+)
MACRKKDGQHVLSLFVNSDDSHSVDDFRNHMPPSPFLEVFGRSAGFHAAARRSGGLRRRRGEALRPKVAFALEAALKEG